ncbi:MAG: hypothetical protein HWD61_11870 [Parachlamydiaceae bacterium]|nr:MAG: hypothetical protein HWD61_11870 [Parachlamydiaceae bacterium]
MNSSALVACLSKGYVDWAWKLLPASDVNQANNLNMQAIHLATRLGASSLVAELIERGAQVDNLALLSLTSTRKVTPCHIAVINDQPGILNLLLKNGGSVHLPAENPYYGRGDNKEPLTAFQMAEKYQRKTCKDLIEKHSFSKTVNGSHENVRATNLMPQRVRANPSLAEIFLDVDSLTTQAGILKSSNALNAKSYSDLILNIKKSVKNFLKFELFISNTLLGHLSKGMAENPTGYTFTQTENSF